MVVLCDIIYNLLMRQVLVHDLIDENRVHDWFDSWTLFDSQKRNNLVAIKNALESETVGQLFFINNIYYCLVFLLQSYSILFILFVLLYFL